MAYTDKWKGKQVILSLKKGDTGGTLLPVACLTVVDIEEKVETETGELTKCDTSVPVTQGAYSYNISASAQILDHNDASSSTKASYNEVRQILQDQRDDDKPTKWELEDVNGDKLSGDGWINSLSGSFPVDTSTFDLAITGVGDITTTSIQ